MENTIRFKTHGDLFRRIDALLDPLADEYKLRFNQTDGLSVRAVDPANVGMVEFEVPASGFEEWSVAYDEAVIGINQNDISTIARYARKGGNSNDNPGDPVEFVYDEDERRGYVRVERDDLDRMRSFATIDPDSIRQEPDLPELGLPWEFSVESKTLRDATKTLSSENYDHVQIATEDLSTGVSGDVTAGVRLWSEGDVREEVFRPDTSATLVRDDADEEEAVSLFSLDYLKDMAKDLHEAKPDAVKVELGTEFPVKIRFSESNYGISGTFMLAPRIMSDDDTPGSYATPEVTADRFSEFEDEEEQEAEATA